MLPPDPFHESGSKSWCLLLFLVSSSKGDLKKKKKGNIPKKCDVLIDKRGKNIPVLMLQRQNVHCKTERKKKMILNVMLVPEGSWSTWQTWPQQPNSRMSSNRPNVCFYFWTRSHSASRVSQTRPVFFHNQLLHVETRSCFNVRYVFVHVYL